MERKKRKIRDPEILKYYNSIFQKYLEERELNEKLIDYVVEPLVHGFSYTFYKLNVLTN